jgi:hypothetical protein
MNIEVAPSPKMNPENEKKLQEHLREIAKILYEEADAKNLDSLAGIEKTIREQTLQYIGPQLRVFFHLFSRFTILRSNKELLGQTTASNSTKNW